MEDAERYYRRVMYLAPESAEARAAMGQVRLASGQPKRAKKWLKRAQRLDPLDPRVGKLHDDLARQGAGG